MVVILRVRVFGQLVDIGIQAKLVVYFVNFTIKIRALVKEAKREIMVQLVRHEILWLDAFELAFLDVLVNLYEKF